MCVVASVHGARGSAIVSHAARQGGAGGEGAGEGAEGQLSALDLALSVRLGPDDTPCRGDRVPSCSPPCLDISSIHRSTSIFHPTCTESVQASEQSKHSTH